jgi:diguanylate cyclase (GGDEF)-like protein/PAS domain S-box-containing protein
MRGEAAVQSILTCITQQNDARLLALAALICTIGVYASTAIAAQAARSEGRARLIWASVSITAAGCTAWATHMVALLAFSPGMESGFDPILTAVSLALPIIGIAITLAVALRRPKRSGRFLAGLILGVSVIVLHYLGQTAYLVTGIVHWNVGLVVVSSMVSLGMFGLSVMVAGERNRVLRRGAAPLLLASIAVLHLCGMTAATLTFDPQIAIPAGAVAPTGIAPIIAAVCLGLLTLAFMGLRMTLSARARQRKDRERLRELASLALEGLAVCDGGLIATANQSLERLSGMKQADLVGNRLATLLPRLALDDLPEQEERDTELITADGQSVPVRVLRKDVLLGHKRQIVVAIRDQRERLRTEARMRTLAFTDALTGLPNRARLSDLVAHHAATLRERGQGFAVLLIDLDRFKLVNDTLGHITGDTLLRQVATRLTSAIGPDDVVARLGGDEFAVLQANIPAEADAPRRLAAAIVALMGHPFTLDGHIVSIGTSVGVAIAPRDGHEPEELLRNADLAMDQAKAEGKATFRVFEPALAERIEARRVLEADLRRALEAEEFEVHYQPLVDAGSGEVTGAEALVRWRHPQRGLIPPIEFIPLAEETGLIAELGAWVLRTACRQAAAWPGDITIAVNLSPLQFRDGGLLETVSAVLAGTGLPARRLELEITEGVMLMDEERTLATLLRLRALGVGIAMDDFGTGYASLSYLRRFPFTKIKVDRSFVRQLPTDAESVGIVRAIITMGACLGMKTTVEGVETAEQYAFVSAERCGQIQGYYVSRPLPPADFVAFLDGLRQAA